jgi:hypothetical protein
MRALVLLAVLVGAWWPPHVTAQGPPDFSGVWTADAEPAPTAVPSPGVPTPRGDMGDGWGSPLTISQDAAQLAVEHARFTRYDLQPPVRLVFALGGSESRNTVMIGHSAQVRVSRTSWEGPALCIRTTYPSLDPDSGQAFTTEVTHRLSLEAPETLVLEVTRGGALGGQPTATRTVFRKR